MNDINPLAIQNKIEVIFKEMKILKVQENLKRENLLLDDSWAKFSESLIQFSERLKKE